MSAGSGPRGDAAGNEVVIDDALGVLAQARARVAADNLVGLAVALLIGAASAIVIAILSGPGILQDLGLNLGVELVGALITVVVIDGLWKRRQATTTESLEATVRRLEARRGVALSPAERDAWRAFADAYGSIAGGTSVIDRGRGIPAYRRRLADLEELARQTLDLGSGGS